MGAVVSTAVLGLVAAICGVIVAYCASKVHEPKNVRNLLIISSTTLLASALAGIIFAIVLL